MSASTPSRLDLQLPSGRVRVERRGRPGDPLVLCVHGLSANLRAFDFLAPRLAEAGRQVVTVDLRGRGRSEITGPGTYGLESHARDLLDLASILGAEQFDLVGWSMGALAGIHAASDTPDRIRRLALLDHAGRMDATARAAVVRALDRLEAVVERPADYVSAIRAAGAVRPWEDLWTRYFEYELVPCGGGWRPSTSRAACLEDLERADVDAVRHRWARLEVPVLLVRCAEPLAGGLIVPAAERDALLRAVPQAELYELRRNHYGLMTDGGVANVLRSFIEARVGVPTPGG